MIATYFTLAALSSAGGRIWKGFCDFIATPVGAALVAGAAGFGVGAVHEHRKVTTAWEQKWAAAEADAERQREERDAKIKAEMQADVDARLRDLNARKAALEQEVKNYEAKHADPGCAVTSADERWLRNAERRYAKPQAGGRHSLRLRTPGP